MRPQTSSLKRYLESEQMVGVMNATRWAQLFDEFKSIKGRVRFRRKDLMDKDLDPQNWETDLLHVFGGVEHIEWLEISGILAHHRGQLVQPRIEDNTDIVLRALWSSKVPFTLAKEGVRVWGYLRPGNNPKWERRDA